jgi:diaminopimelate decarboxylase
MLKLTPKTHKRIRDYLSDKSRLKELVDGLGSPLNLLFPKCPAENAREFLEVFNKNKIKGKVYFAHKPNKSQAIVRQLALENIGIDVASHGELVSALQAGFTGEKIQSTGPKNKKFIRLALQHKVVIAVYSMDELLIISQIAAELKIARTRILLRVCNFSSAHTKIYSKDTRFGIDIQKIEGVYKWLQKHTEIELIGLTFYLNTANITEKVIAIENSLKALIIASSYGLSPSVLNIGGGFRISYLESAVEWDRYISELKCCSVLEGSSSLTWDGSGLGYRNENGTLKGSPQFIDSFIDQTGPEEFSKILNTPLPAFSNTTFKQILDELLFELWIEPGRAMLDQAGITAAKVLSVKHSAKGELVVALDINRSNLNSQDFIVLANPTILYQTPKEHKNEIGVFFAGNTCLESDLLTRHKTFVDQLPEPEDIVVFHNTAAYIMDFAESNTLQQNTAKKIAITEINNNFSWSLDDNYEPI